MPTTSVDTTSTAHEKGLARAAQRTAAWTEKWFPDAYVFALAGVVIVSLAAMVNGASPVTVAGEWLEHSRILPALVGLLTLGWLVDQLMTLPFLSVISSLNGYLMVFLILGLVLHGTPRGFLDAVTKAVPTTAGVLVQFPLYAAMAAVLTRARATAGSPSPSTWPTSSPGSATGVTSPW